jgi:glycosyltransferase involved in cell wall biosynthesis
MLGPMKLAVVIPVYNEAALLPVLFERVMAVTPPIVPGGGGGGF